MGGNFFEIAMRERLGKRVVCSRINIDFPKHNSFQGNGFFGTDFLAAKTDDASLGVHSGKAISQG